MSGSTPPTPAGSHIRSVSEPVDHLPAVVAGVSATPTRTVAMLSGAVDTVLDRLPTANQPLAAHDEWQVSAERRYLSERSMALVVNRSVEEVAKPELKTA